jgi:ATP-dependent DNA helicase RecG
MFDVVELTRLVNTLRQEPDETEWLEFKENHYEPQLLGEYLSALSNSACLHRRSKGYLIFGIEDKTHAVKGTGINPAKLKGKGNQNLYIWLSVGLLPNVGFDVFPFEYQGRSIVLFAINAAIDKPVSFYGKACVRIGSNKTELSKYPEKEREIWNRSHRMDWSARICEKATIEDLDPEAIKRARVEYKTKFPAKISEVEGWDDTQFLNKLKLTVKGKITNSAILLLGRPESATLISPAVAKITWVLKDDKNMEKDYEHFGPPFILNVERVFSKIRNLTYRHMPSGTLFPIEITQYDRWVIREALHNCIAHQDYSLCGRINLVETHTSLTLTNRGSFLPGSVENVITQDAPPEIYRNPFLAEAMVNLNMIDTQGGGIKRMFQTQMKRYFPMPDYDLGEADRVVVKILGQVLDEKYTRLLMESSDLDLWTVILLDKVQKRVRISRKEYKKLKDIRAVEGRYPNIFVSSWVAAATAKEAQHIRNKGLDTKYYKEITKQLVREHGPVSRKKIDQLLLDKLPEVLTEKQKKNKIHNILASLAGKEGIFENIGSNRYPQWVLKEIKKH